MSSVKFVQLLLAFFPTLSTLANPLPDHSATELTETSGEELQDSARAFAHQKWDHIAKALHKDVTSLRDEQFRRDFDEPLSNMTKYAFVREQTPQLSSADGCYSTNFDAHRCLRRIYAGLRTYREYMSYVDKMNLTTVMITDVQLQTTRLINMIKNKVTVTHTTPISPLPEGSAWNQRRVTHSVLYNLAVFLKETIRAIDHINKKGMNLIRTEIKEPKWPSEKHEHQ
ncbi:interleukin-6 [Hoplias malabaricus]|uniref:interleukin-6 n=1 Tax=Hoplias malabaricus TaxID=27720 RepID=UPI0034627004